MRLQRNTGTLELRQDFWFTDISNVWPPPATPTAEDVPNAGEAPWRITDEDQAFAVYRPLARNAANVKPTPRAQFIRVASNA